MALFSIGSWFFREVYQKKVRLDKLDLLINKKFFPNRDSNPGLQGENLIS